VAAEVLPKSLPKLLIAIGARRYAVTPLTAERRPDGCYMQFAAAAGICMYMRARLIHCYVVTIMISHMSKLFIRTEMEDFYWRKMRIDECQHSPTSADTRNQTGIEDFYWRKMRIDECQHPPHSPTSADTRNQAATRGLKISIGGK
jgi:hypothetical protein